MAIPIRTLCIALVSLALLIMVAHFYEFIRYALAAVHYRFEIDGPEGIVWQQAMLIPGPHMYGDINQFPFIVFHYPPLYHLLARAVSLLGCTPLFAGRALSLAASMVSAVTISAIAWRLAGPEAERLARLMGGAASALVFFCFFPIVLTSSVMRVDMLAIAFSYLGLLCFVASRPNSWQAFAGMAFFVLAVFTKQTSIAAPLAAVIVSGLIAPRQAAKLVGFGLVLGAIPLAILTLYTSGGFLRHIVLYNINRFYFDLAWRQIAGQSAQLVFVLLAFSAIAFWWRRYFVTTQAKNLQAWRDALARDDWARSMCIVTLYLFLSTLMLAEVGKSGAGISYFDEWVGILSIWIGVLVAQIAAPVSTNNVFADIKSAPILRLAFPVLLIVQVSILPAKGKMNFSDQAQTQEADELVDKIAQADKPVLSVDMVMLMMAGKQVPWEPAIFAELANLGRWDESRITRMIAAHKFAFVITKSSWAFTPAITDAINAAYPRVTEIAQRTVHLPE